MDSIPHFFPVCVCDPNLMTRSTSQHLTCENIFAVEGFSEGGKGHMESPNTGTWVTTSRKEGAHGCRKHLGAILAYLFSKPQRANLSPRDQKVRTNWQMSGVFLGPGGNSFIYSFISKSLSSGVWSQCKPVTICLNDLKTARVGTESILSVPKQLKAWAVMELGQVLHFHTCTVCSFPNVPSPPVFKSDCIPLVWEMCSTVFPPLPNISVPKSLA